MIKTVHFHNFKALREVTVDLERFSVLVGPNASGKTSILEGLYLLAQLRDRQPADVFQVDQGRAFWRYSRGARDGMELGLAGPAGAVRLTASFTGPFPENVLQATPSTTPGGTWVFKTEENDAGDLEGPWVPAEETRVRQVVPAAVFLRLDADHLARPSHVPNSRPTIAAGGAGLASVLSYIAGNRPDDFQRLQELLRSVIPSVRRVRLDRVPVDPGHAEHPRPDWDESLVLDLEGAPEIPGPMVSQGILFVLGVLAAVLGPDGPRLLLLDDLDRGLHPRAQRDLVVLLRKLLEQDPGLQLVATTHSPYIIDELKPEEVRLTALTPEGSVVSGRLEQHPEFEKWKDEMTPGELWRVLGEQWLVERPLQEAAP